MLYLIDTSAWILALRKNGNRDAINIISAILDEDTAATCPIIMLELLSGVKSKKQYEELLEDLKALHNIPITDEVWEYSFKLGFELRNRGITVPAADILIASAAIKYDQILLHYDKHFDLISNRSKLKVKRM